MSEITPSSHTFVAKEAITTARGFTKKYFWVVLGLLVISMLPSLGEALFDIMIQQIPGATQSVIDPVTNMAAVEPVGVWAIISSIVYIIVGVLGAWLGLGLVKGYFSILEDKKPEWNIITSAPWIQVARLIGGGILVGLAVVL